MDNNNRDRERMPSMHEETKRVSMIRQTIVIFVFSIILIGSLSAAVLFFYAIYSVRYEKISDAEAVARDIEGYIEAFPAHEWLMRYWYDNQKSLDIEYDVPFSADTETAEKCRVLAKRHPDFQLEYAEVSDVEALPPEDRKLYAEIVYSWIITYIDRIAVGYDISYVFCFETSAPYEKASILLIADNLNKERGDSPGMLYPFGKVLDLTADEQKAIAGAVPGTPQISLNGDGRYANFFYHTGSFDDHEVMIGLAWYYPKYLSMVRSGIMRYVLMFLVFLSIFAVVCILRLRSRILSPVEIIQQAIRKYKISKDSTAAIETLSAVVSNNELEDLSDDIASMTRAIDDYTSRIRKITAESERIETELSLASRIQLAVMPTDYGSVRDQNIDIYASIKPARVVGGDFYDFFMIDDDHLCIMIADVSGKGIPAALFVMESKITLKHTVKEVRSPAGILTEVNRSISENNPEDMFVTVWLGILDLRTGRLTAANAGHEYPVLRDPGDTYRLIKDSHGFVLGTVPDVSYTDYELDLKPGTTLFVYTDGLPEATAADDSMFGTERMLTELNRAPDASPEETIANITQAVNEFAGDAEQFDDLTMLCIRYNGMKADQPA